MDQRIQVDQHQLAEAWQQTLPDTLQPGDRAQVKADEANPQGLRIHIDTAGHTHYSFDFECAYLDSREVHVNLVDVERDGRTIDERSEHIQQLAEDYTRHIHECAQTLHYLTKQ
ncbi:hypothetical protein PASE110613_17320 [Paenibacillus sediminis]|uniref:Uncharacterized protein n=1 Tax=Paenibacillus sediminis TaxID=664909 RepID=A0ABS4H7S7_9BACL|nr:hypothetical protein [Paenibacillus sediminis]MBP1938584.1 hypothetical protein [Paenibacillus sediminis]